MLLIGAVRLAAGKPWSRSELRPCRRPQPGEEVVELPVVDAALPHACDHTNTSVMGSDESAGRSRDDGPHPAASSRAPNAATIAPLSVHNPGRGTRSRIPKASQR